MKWGRKFKISNPPKKSGYYYAFHWVSITVPMKLYFSANTKIWHRNEYDPSPTEFGNEFPTEGERWARIVEEQS